MESTNQKKKATLIKYLLPFIGGILIGYFGFHATAENPNNRTNGIRQGGYQFINPLLECDVDGGLESKTLKPLEQSVNKLIASFSTSNKINHISVYFRDLNNGPWFGIDEEEPFSPASLLKVPVMMTYYHLAEKDKDILTDTIPFETKTTNSSNQLQLDTAYSIDELIGYMIRDSDNDSFSLLVSQVNNDEINKTLQDLGLTVPDVSTPENYISVRSYASLFRVLFNASYLSRDMSERALELLSTSTYKDGLRAGVPASITVANKFGVRANKEDQEKQLHDCGVIYYPDHPYLLCVMTRGENLNELATIIGNISKNIYDYTDAIYKK